MKNLAIIPARGGSKRIPRKNVKPFLGKPIIAYSIEAALKCGLFDEVMVSTDDEEIGEISKEYGANVPFMRSAKNADDFATTSDVILEVLSHFQTEFENACCIYPTAPFITDNILKESYNRLINNNFDSVFPVVRYGYPMQRSLKATGKKISMVWPEYLNSRSQDLEARFHDVGQFYWFTIADFRKEQKMFTNNSGYIEVSELAVQDIDNETDWELAELKYKLLKKKSKPK